MRLHQPKKLLPCKGDVNKMKRQPTDWEKIFVNYITNKELIPRI